MTQGSQVPVVERVTPLDQFLVWQLTNGRWARVPEPVLVEYLRRVLGIGALAQQYYMPTTEDWEVQVNDLPISTWLIATPTIPSGEVTINLPSQQQSVNGQEILVNVTQDIATLIVAAEGAQVIGPPESMLANEAFRMKYDAVTKIWYCINKCCTGGV